MKPQDIINYVWDYYAVKKNPRSYVDGVCMYRGPGGVCCPVGLFILDDEYMPGFEGKSFRTLYANGLLRDPFFVTHLHLFDGLQRAHDDFSDILIGLQDNIERLGLALPNTP